MNSNFTTDFKKQAIFTAQTYGTKTTVEVDHSDLSLDEVMDVFQTLIIGMGYHENSFKNWVIERAQEYNETDAEDLKEKLEAWKFDDDNDIVLRHQYEDREELENETPKPGYDWDETFTNERMDIIGQNGNDGLHYRATEEDEAEFDDYGKRIEKDAVSFEWGDEPEEDYDGQFNDWKNETPEDNLELKEGYKKYKKALKTLSAKQKKKSK
jgi:hypothetical protein